jgi:hypothetical protein
MRQVAFLDTDNAHGSTAIVIVRATPTARRRSGLRPQLVVDVSCGDVDLVVLGALDSRAPELDRQARWPPRTAASRPMTAARSGRRLS